MPRLQNWKIPSKPDGCKHKILFLGGGKRISNTSVWLHSPPLLSPGREASQAAFAAAKALPCLLEMVYRVEKKKEQLLAIFFLASCRIKCCYVGSLVPGSGEEQTPGPALLQDTQLGLRFPLVR